MTSARLLPTTEEVQERLARVEMSALEAQRVIMREKLFAEVEIIRRDARCGLPVDGRIADVLETLIARLT
ncbi:MAG: hypothetical protein E6Q77_06645 [Rhizobium sp.]|nr:MAG: hypothetical protein E6Q77_06645 [Rhizobium sp.]